MKGHPLEVVLEGLRNPTIYCTPNSSSLKGYGAYDGHRHKNCLTRSSTTLTIQPAIPWMSLANYDLRTDCCIYLLEDLHPFNGPLSGTTQVSRYEKGRTNLDFTEATDSEWQWHQLDHMQVCTSLQTDNHASTPSLSFFHRPDALPAAQPTASKHWRH